LPAPGVMGLPGVAGDFLGGLHPKANARVPKMSNNSRQLDMQVSGFRQAVLPACFFGFGVSLFEQQFQHLFAVIALEDDLAVFGIAAAGTFVFQ